MKNEKEVSTLNDLIRINNDRIEGYQKAIKDLEEPADRNMVSVFTDRMEESRQFKAELVNEVTHLGENPENDSSTPGDIYRTWMDLKTAFTGGSKKSVLELCEYGEDVALKAYKKALEKGVNWSQGVRSRLTGQLNVLQAAHDIIKSYRDGQTATAS